MTTLSIRPDTLEQFAYTNAALFTGAPRAIVLNFHGLNCCDMRSEPTSFEARCAEEKVLTLYPYYGPWSWMNRDAIRYVDSVVEAALACYGLCALPIVSTGGSMGGLSAIIYTRYAWRTPVACFANSPVCDLPYHATERPDLPRTVYLAFASYDCGLESAMRQHSPLHQAAELPRIPYYVVHGTADSAVNKAMHSDRFVEAMRAAGQRIDYHEVEGMTHCDLAAFPKELAAYEDGILGAALSR